MTDSQTAGPDADQPTPPTENRAASYAPDGSGGDTSGGGADAVRVPDRD